ncbi:O-methyltransferase [Lentzea xinjiangensis]|uniref:O-methyltransferase n=2 Tax=Lentzea xinjiangensis TaxID=402600 RepID=A0A1H9PCU7_9PSEU|nr:O-methyltransferase [Lentzea xinjiangensis]
MALADLATPMAIRVAATLGLVEHAGTGGATAAELAGRTGAAAGPLRRLLDHLVTVEVFEVESGRYRPTALGAQMHPDAPEGVKPLLDITCAGGRAELAFVDLLDTVTTGAPAYPIRYGKQFWDDLGDSPKLRRSFEAQMNWRFREHAPRIAANFDWSRFPTIVDVGGGDGPLLVEILSAHPTVRGQVVDLPPTAAAATARFAALGIGDRASTVAGSFFDPLPAGADAYLLSDILHDWDDEPCEKILTQVRDACAPHSTVVLVEPVRGYGAATDIDLFMLMCFNGRERTVDELTSLAAGCGLTFQRAVPVSEGRMALELTLRG